MNRPGILALAALLGVSLPTAVRADRLDTRLHEVMPSVVEKLKEKGYKNVGVLRFRVQQGDAKPGFAPPLCGATAASVENFLVIHGGAVEEKALGVIHAAGRAAARQKVGSWFDSPAGRRRLFEIEYPLAWGKSKVKPDALLTGKVKTSKDLRTTTVTLEYLDRAAPDKLVVLKEFSFNTDRDVLRGLGYSFVRKNKARSRYLVARGGGADVEDPIWEELPNQNEKQPENKKAEDKKPQDKKPEQRKPEEKKPKKKSDKDDEEVTATPDSVGEVQVQLLVGGKPQEITEASTKGDGIKWQVDSPPPGKPIAFKLTNNSARRLGVVLRLNGVNTVNQQKDEPERCRKWILDAGESQVVRGFYMLEEGEGKKAKMRRLPFKVLVGSEARMAKEELLEKAGLIEVDVFEVGSEKPEPKISARGLPPSEEKLARESYVRLRDDLIRAARLKTKRVEKREIIVPDESALPDGPVEGARLIDFDNPQLLARIAVKVIPAEPKLED
jgi:hypothetical protein